VIEPFVLSHGKSAHHARQLIGPEFEGSYFRRVGGYCNFSSCPKRYLNVDV